jgi:phosphatidylserine/phosphatidylglycerophosphate/cardiolipin synthase-like enzyme
VGAKKRVGQSQSRKTTITGSFNFSKAAEEKNRENLLVLRSKSLAKFYMDNWQENLNHTREF